MQPVATTVILQQLASGIVTLLAMLVVHFLPVQVG